MVWQRGGRGPREPHLGFTALDLGDAIPRQGYSLGPAHKPGVPISGQGLRGQPVAGAGMSPEASPPLVHR